MRNPKQPEFPTPPAGVPTPLEVNLFPRGLLILCLFIQGWLVILHYHLAQDPNPGVAVLGQAFDITREDSIPTAWACLQALIVGAFALLVLLHRCKQGIPLRRSGGWLIASILFTVIAIDDAASLHERIGSITSLGMMDRMGYPSYPWHVVVAPVFALGLFLTVFLLWGDLKQIRGGRATVIAALACYGISQGIDFFEGLQRMSQFYQESLSPMLPHWMIFEETLEMAGTSLFAYAFASILIKNIDGIPITFRSGESVARFDPEFNAAGLLHGAGRTADAEAMIPPLLPAARRD